MVSDNSSKKIILTKTLKEKLSAKKRSELKQYSKSPGEYYSKPGEVVLVLKKIFNNSKSHKKVTNTQTEAIGG
jgi:predicted RNA-binding protein